MTNSSVYIVGAGGLGRELAFQVEQTNFFNILGFIDDNRDALVNTSCNYDVVSSIKDFKVEKLGFFLIAIGNPIVRQEVVMHLKDKKCIFASFVHPNSIYSNDLEIGEGSIILANTFISCDVKIGDYSIVNVNTSIGHDCRIGNFVTISPGCSISGSTHIENNVFIASSSVTIPGTKIERNASIGANSLVIKRVLKNTSVFGNPAKLILK